jgi:2-isopropylmalate synthase
VKANCAARTHVNDIAPIAGVVQRTGVPIECCTFIGSSPIRQYTEGWTLDWLLKNTEEAIAFAVKEGLEVMYVTEDTTRAHPDTLRALYTCAIRSGARRLCIADTVGHATPAGAAAVVKFAKQVIDETGADVGIDWHGHRDRDLAVINSIAALHAGATRLHAAALGIGERVGNTPMDMLLVNFVLMGYRTGDLRKLAEYCEVVSKACGVPVPDNYPVVGRDAFRTATGVHAAAVVKAWKKGDIELMDRVYSAIPASLVGREQIIDVGPMSGKSNVIFWLEKRGIPADEPLVERIFQKAKASKTVLTDDEIFAEVYQLQGQNK